jgi:hypothetical protein
MFTRSTIRNSGPPRICRPDLLSPPVYNLYNDGTNMSKQIFNVLNNNVLNPRTCPLSPTVMEPARRAGATHLLTISILLHDLCVQEVPWTYARGGMTTHASDWRKPLESKCHLASTASERGCHPRGQFSPCWPDPSRGCPAKAAMGRRSPMRVTGASPFN